MHYPLVFLGLISICCGLVPPIARKADLSIGYGSISGFTKDCPSSYAVSFENPPFFPTTLEELADDAAFATKVALVSRLNRIRIDVRLRMTKRDRHMFKWLILMAESLLDDVFTKVHVFVDKSQDLTRCREIWEEMMAERRLTTDNDDSASGASNSYDGGNTASRRIAISPMSDINLRHDDSILVIFNPDNIYSCEHPDLLEDVQALCFHAALRSIPVVLINPTLMSTAWNDYGVQQPMLLSDFAQAYYICDDYFMLTRRDQWCGIIQRAASGFDLFLLEGLSTTNTAPSKYTRLKSWADGMPNDLKSQVARVLRADPNFPINVQARKQYERQMKQQNSGIVAFNQNTATAAAAASSRMFSNDNDYATGNGDDEKQQGSGSSTSRRNSNSNTAGMIISKAVIEDIMKNGLRSSREPKVPVRYVTESGISLPSASTSSSTSSLSTSVSSIVGTVSGASSDGGIIMSGGVGGTSSGAKATGTSNPNPNPSPSSKRSSKASRVVDQSQGGQSWKSTKPPRARRKLSTSSNTSRSTSTSSSTNMP